MQNKYFACFNVFSFLARRAGSTERPARNNLRRLTLEALEPRAMLSLSAIPYGPIYRADDVLKSAENSATFVASELPGEADVASERTDLNLEVKTSTCNDGQVLSLTLNASKTISVWQIDWGDGSAPDVYEKLGDSLIAAHRYELQWTEQEYAVVATLIESDEYSNEDGYLVAFHTTPAKYADVGTITTDGSQTTFAAYTFCDAEKSSSSNSNLCWAAGASNSLYYAGWATSEPLTDASGESASFESEDDVYSYFTDNFSNGGSSSLYALEWFITGNYKGDDGVGWAQRTDDSGGFYADVDFDDVAGYYSYRSKGARESIMPSAMEQLAQGWAVCASLGYYSSSPNGALRGAHTLSVWGFVCDENYSSDDPEFYTALIISDPDDSKYGGRSAENKLVTIQLKWSDAYERYQLTNYSSSSSVWLEEFVTLAPRASVTATPRTAETLAAVLPLDVQQREKENFFEVLKELEEVEVDFYFDEQELT